MATIGMKLSRQLTTGSLMLVIPLNTDDLQWKKVAQLAKEMSLSKSMFSRPLSASVVSKLYKFPDRIRFQFLGAETFLSVATLASQFPAHLGRMLALAETTFLTVIPPETMEAVAAFMHPEASQGAAGIFPGFVQQALKHVGITQFKITLVNTGGESLTLDDDGTEDGEEGDGGDPEDVDVPIRLLRIDILEANREVVVDCAGQMMEMVCPFPLFLSPFFVFFLDYCPRVSACATTSNSGAIRLQPSANTLHGGIHPVKHTAGFFERVLWALTNRFSIRLTRSPQRTIRRTAPPRCDPLVTRAVVHQCCCTGQDRTSLLTSNLPWACRTVPSGTRCSSSWFTCRS